MEFLLSSKSYRSIEPPLISRGEDDEDLNVLGFLHPDDLPLQVEVLGAVVSEDHDEGALRGVLEGHQQALGQSLPAVPPPVERLEHQAGGLLGKSSNIRSVNLQPNIPVDLPAVVIEGDQLEPVMISVSQTVTAWTGLTWEY